MNEQAQEAISRLSKAELQVVKLLAHGVPLKVIADRLHRSYYTIEAQRLKAYRKLGVKKAAQVAVLCTLAGLVTEWRAGV